MLAGEYVAGEGVTVSQIPRVPPAHGEVQIAVAFTGICGTDLHIAHGAMDSRTGERRVLGHEMSGVVAELGEGVTGLAIGTAVTVMPLLWCGSCPTCVSGNSHICENLNFVGIDSTGSLQEFWNVPAELVIPMPEGISLRDAALVEPIAVARHDVERGRLVAGEQAVVVGGGPVGLLMAIVAAERGADVLVVEPDAYRRSVIGRLGFLALDPAEDVESEVSARTGGAGADIAFEVSGSQPGLDTAVSVLRPRGRLVAVGIHTEPRLVDLKRVFWRELEILGARVYDRSDFEAAIALVAAGKVPADALITRVVPLESAPDAFELLRRGGAVMKVLVDSRAGGRP
jgi:2-desacetyl-2-hydroxyethyl bacteriochlorophyllide A dehydrogenase